MNHEDRKKLFLYSKKLGLENAFTVEQLINSHRRLGECMLLPNDHFTNELENARRMGIQQARDRFNNEYFTRERLRAMTLKELADYLHDDIDG